MNCNAFATNTRALTGGRPFVRSAAQLSQGGHGLMFTDAGAIDPGEGDAASP
jgi:hypothetical protein